MPDRPSPPILRWAAVAIVFLWGACQAFWNLNALTINADEYIYRLAGWEYIHGIYNLNLEHPPTAKYIIGLFELLFGPTYLAGRIAAATVSFGTGIILWVWLKREIGWYYALIPAGLWLLLPRGMSGAQPGTRIDRLTLLEPFMILFAVAAFAAAWAWYRDRSWFVLALAGACMGLSATSKVTTAVLLPAFLILILGTRRLKTILFACVIFYGTAAAVAVLVYLPLGIRHALGYMISFQAQQNKVGHLTIVDGVAYAHPPWWTNLNYLLHGTGLVTVIVLAAGILVSLFAKPRILIAYLATGLGLLLVFYLAIAQNALTNYYYAWMWAASALTGIGIAWLLKRRGPWRIAALIVACILLVGAVRVSVQTSIEIWQARPFGMARVPDALKHAHVTGRILAEGLAPTTYGPYVKATTNPADKVAAILTMDSPRFPIDPVVKAFLAEHSNEYTRTVLDDISLYVLDTPQAIATK